MILVFVRCNIVDSKFRVAVLDLYSVIFGPDMLGFSGDLVLFSKGQFTFLNLKEPTSIESGQAGT